MMNPHNMIINKMMNNLEYKFKLKKQSNLNQSLRKNDIMHS